MQRMEKIREFADHGLLGAKLRSKSPLLRVDRPLDPTVGFSDETWSARRLNKISSGMNLCTSYLEIGVQYGLTLQGVNVPFRWGVDPQPKCNLKRLPAGLRLSATTSDEFFENLSSRTKFDLIFLDGLHQWQQTYRDLVNALRHSHLHSIILIDDILPSDEYSADPNQETALRNRRAAGGTGREWQGDVYKLMQILADHFEWLDWGVALSANANAQAIIWRRDSTMNFIPPELDTLRDQYAKIDYRSTFRDGAIPHYFKAADEDEVINHATAASRRMLS